MLNDPSNGARHQTILEVSHTIQGERSNEDELDYMQINNENEIVVHEGETNERELLLDYSDKRIDSDSEEGIVQALPIVPVDDIMFVEDSDCSEDKQCNNNNNVDGLLDVETREV